MLVCFKPKEIFNPLPDLRKDISSISSRFGIAVFELSGWSFEFCTTSIVITGAFALNLASIGYMVAENERNKKILR